MPIREIDITTGEYKRVTFCPVRRMAKGPRGKRNNMSREAQAHLNEINSQKTLSDLFHLNFTPDDYAVHLTYRPEYMPASALDGETQVRNYMRRARYKHTKKGGLSQDFKYIAVTECSSTGRVHHHCVISSSVLTREEIEDCWGRGRVQTKPLQFDENGLIGLACYITKEKTTYRRWTSSQNLTKPSPKQNDYRITQKAVKYIIKNLNDYGYIEKLFPGYSVSPGGITIPSDAAQQFGLFVTIEMYRTDNLYFRRKSRKTPHGVMTWIEYGYPKNYGILKEGDQNAKKS